MKNEIEASRARQGLIVGRPSLSDPVEFSLAMMLCRARARRLGILKPAAMAANESSSADECIAVNEASGTMEPSGVMVVPYGEVPVMVSQGGRVFRGLQRIDAEAANAMASEMNGVMGQVKKVFRKYPIYLGHPYHPDPKEAAKFTDRKARGVITSIEAANEGIRLVPEYNSLGRNEVEDKQLLYHSPQWKLAPVMAANGAQEVKNGMPVFRPIALHSASLTNNPNIEVPPIMAGNEAAAETPPLVASIKAALLKEGLIQDGDSDSTIMGAIGNLISSLAWERAAKQREADEAAAIAKALLMESCNEKPHAELVQDLISAHADVSARLQTAEAAATAANERAAAERSARAAAVLEPLITAGRIKISDQDSVRTQLVEAANEADFSAVLQEAQKAPSKLQTKAKITHGLQGGAKLAMAANDAGNRNSAREAAVGACLKELQARRAPMAGDRDRAWQLARQRNPELFAH